MIRGESMKIFSVPADFEIKSIEKYTQINERNRGAIINETYGQLTEGYIHNSGRATGIIPAVNMRDLEKYVDFSLKKGIIFNYTINAACFGNLEFSDTGIKQIKELLTDLKNIGVENLTLTTPGIIELVKCIAPEMKIKASAICQINSVEKLKHYLRLGIDRFVVEPSIIRDFTILRNMAKIASDKMEIIINDKCMRDCPYRIFHYNQTAHDNNENAESYYFMSCGVEKSQNILKYLNLNWIRPEDLCLYQNIGIKYLKVEGREFIKTGNVERLLESYINESFDGNLLDLLHVFAPYDFIHQPYIDNKKLEGYVKGFYNEDVVCQQVCKQCGYCESYARKAFKMSKDMPLEASEYYRTNNRYLNRLKSEIKIG